MDHVLQDIKKNAKHQKLVHALPNLVVDSNLIQEKEFGLEEEEHAKQLENVMVL